METFYTYRMVTLEFGQIQLLVYVHLESMVHKLKWNMRAANAQISREVTKSIRV